MTAIMFGDAYTFHLTYLGNRPNSSLRPSDADSARLTIHGDRDKLLHSLLKSYILPPLLKMGLMKVVKPKAAGFNHLRKFHDETYLNCIRNGPKWLSNKMRQEYTQWEEEEEEKSKNDEGNENAPPPPTPLSPSEILEKYNLVDDCALPPTAEGRAQLWSYISFMSGATLHAASLLQPYPPAPPAPGQPKPVTTALNWGGGRHHAQRAQAGGFCYVNDAVLGCDMLRRKFGKVLYVDIDIHHCDGVEAAFDRTDKVVTLSFHKYEKGFFPGTGAPLGRHSKVNVPLPPGITDDLFLPLYSSAVSDLASAHASIGSPFGSVCLAVGADGLADDPIVGRDGWALSTRGLSSAVRSTCLLAKKLRLPLLVLGGGGYSDVNASRAFAACTVAACEGPREGVLARLPDRVPDHEHFPRYAPTFEIHTKATAKGEHGTGEGTRRGRRVWAGVEDARGVLRGALGEVEARREGGFRFDED